METDHAHRRHHPGWRVLYYWGWNMWERGMWANPTPLLRACSGDGHLGLPAPGLGAAEAQCLHRTQSPAWVCTHVCIDTLCCTPARYILQASQESAQTSCWLSRADTAPEEASLICQCKAFAKHKWVHTFTRPLLTQRWIAFITRILIFKRNWWAPGKESRMLSHIWELCFTQPLQQLAFAGRDERY